MTAQLEVGTTWLPVARGPHLWSDIRLGEAAADLAAMRRAGFTTVRVHLAWDAFMPTSTQVSRHRVRDLGGILETARGLGMRCVLVLFAQSFGNGLLLPRYAIDRRHPRPGIRVVTEGVLEAGGPRDQWADPLMLEVEVMWLGVLLAAFANHPAVAAWDLGHDPASTLRPRRTADTAAWAELLGGMVRERGDRVRLTLGAGDVLVARGMRLAAVAPHLDELGLLLDPQRLRLEMPHGYPDVAGSAFTVQLAARLGAVADVPAALHVVTGVAAGDAVDIEDQQAVAAIDDARARATVRRSVGLAGEAPPPVEDAARPAWDVRLLDPPTAARLTDELLTRLRDSGAAGLTSTAWTLLSDRVATSAPLEGRSSLARHGLARPDGDVREVGVPWAAMARAEPAVSAAAPWPADLDIEEYYAALPDSAHDLLSAWREERDDGGEGRGFEG